MMTTTEEMQAEWAKAIADAGVATEEEMRENKVPRLKTADDLLSYINSLVDRPHDYGTCVYAMSMAAVAALNYVAGKLGVTGFQASCADLDILRRTRALEMGFRILDYEKLLYPQHLTTEHFPSWGDLLDDPELRGRLREAAAAKLENGPTHPDVEAWWRELAQ
jgi:hypothetical protein